MKFSMNQWANGQEGIDITDYDYSKAGFLTILEPLCQFYKTSIPDIDGGLDMIFADINKDGQVITLQMDNWTFSIAFPSKKMRDDALAWLKNEIR